MFLPILLASGQELARGVAAMNAGSYLPDGLPHSGVAPGARFVLLGRDLGPAEPVEQANPDATSLSGVSVKVSVGGTEVDAWPMLVSARRIEALLPRSVATGRGTVTVTVQDRPLTAPIEVVTRAPGVVTRGRQGQGMAWAANASGDAVTLAASVRPGEQVRLRTTGLGVADSLDGVEIVVANRVVAVGAVTRLPNGYDDLTFTLPEVEGGCAVPVAVRLTGFWSNFATLPVSATGGICADRSIPENVDRERVLREGGKVGTIFASRGEVRTPEFGIQTDTGGASFLAFQPIRLDDASSFGSGQTLGACTLVRVIEQDIESTVTSTGLDAGPKLTMTGPLGAKDLNKESTGSYAGKLGERMMIDIPGFPGLPGGSALYLDPGSYTITGTGGADVGAFTAQLTVPRAVEWTNGNTLGAACGNQRCVDRTQDLKIDWQGGDSQRIVAVTGFGSLVDRRPSVGVVFACIERADRGTLTIPAGILAALPASPATGEADSILSLLVSPITPGTFSASGIDYGVVSYTQSILRQIRYR